MAKGASRERFVRLAEKRVGRTLKMMRSISALADRSRYDYDDRDAEKIIVALESDLNELKARFASETTKRSITFTLDKG